MMIFRVALSHEIAAGQLYKNIKTTVPFDGFGANVSIK